MTQAITIKELQPEDMPRWDAFVMDCPEASFFHRSGWKTVIEQAFGHRCYYYYAEAAGEIVGVLPLGHIRSLIFGNALISTPFCVYGGVVAGDAEVREQLLAQAQTLAEQLGVDYLELRNRERRHQDWPCKELYVTFRKELAPEDDANMQAIPRKQRAMVRKGISAGLSSEIDPGIDCFFDAYSQSVHALGTPVFPKRYFQIVKDIFGKDCDVLTVVKDGRTISSVVNFYFRDEVLPYYGGGTAEARQLKGNDFMYWEVMRHALQRGAHIFDYGRSKVDSGSYSFKKNWGFEPTPLYYEYYLVKARQMPDISPVNPKFQLFIGIWKRLPLALTRIIGPMVARYLG